MNIDLATLKQWQEIVSATADESLEISNKYFQKSKISVETKKDNSPVTEADKLLESRIRSIIRQVAPSHGIIGEEEGSERERSEYVWTVDPIDGTYSFISGVPFFGTQLALLFQGQAVLGSIFMPLLKIQIIGDGKSTTINGQLAQGCNSCSLSRARLAVTDIADVARHHDIARFNHLCSRVSAMRTWGDCYGYNLLVSGGINCMLDAAIDPWDIAPLGPIVCGAGGQVSDWNGALLQPQPFQFASSCIAAQACLQTEIVSILNASNK